MLDQEGYPDEQYLAETKTVQDPMTFFRAAGRLMHRKGFFERPTKNLGHL